MRNSSGLFDAAALSRLLPKVVMADAMMLAEITRATEAISVIRTLEFFMILEYPRNSTGDLDNSSKRLEQVLPYFASMNRVDKTRRSLHLAGRKTP